jgi:hypothetical protein
MTRIAVTVVIEMTNEQERAYADEYGIGDASGKFTKKQLVNDVREYVLTSIQHSAAFGSGGADVNLR